MGMNAKYYQMFIRINLLVFVDFEYFVADKNYKIVNSLAIQIFCKKTFPAVSYFNANKIFSSQIKTSVVFIVVECYNLLHRCPFR